MLADVNKFSLISMKLITYRLYSLPLHDIGRKKKSLIAILSYLNILEITAICQHACTSPDFEHVIFAHP